MATTAGQPLYPLALDQLLEYRARLLQRLESQPGEFAAVIMIAYFPLVISTLIYTRFTQYGLAETVAVAVVLLVTCMAVLVLLRRVASRLWRPDATV